MSILKQILAYFLWALVSLFSGIGYMYIILGSKPKSSKSFLKILDGIYGFVLIYVGSIIGGIIALLYILIDLFFLRKRLKNNSHKTLFRFLIIVIITIVVGATHYICEKVINII